MEEKKKRKKKYYRMKKISRTISSKQQTCDSIFLTNLSQKQLDFITRGVHTPYANLTSFFLLLRRSQIRFEREF